MTACARLRGRGGETRARLPLAGVTMSRFLANENVPGEVVASARQAGHDLAWIVELSPGADDDWVLATALAESRV